MKAYAKRLFDEAAKKLDYLNDVDYALERPKQEAHGDLSCNAAMLLARALKRKPREIAQEIVDALEPDDAVEKIEIAGAGFVNFFFSNAFLANAAKDALERGEKFGASDLHKGKTANVEFVSANPTGPLTVGHGRNAVVGDAVANFLEAVGYQVDREYYFNNAGRQMRVLGESVKARYLEALGETTLFEDHFYRGEYVKEIAEKLVEEHGDNLKDEPAEGAFKARAEAEIFKDIAGTLERLNVRHDRFYNERDLYDDGRIDATLDAMKERGLSYEKEGALWFKFSEMGGEEDRVMVKSTGEPTYRLPDVAYHLTKFERGYDAIVDVFGADHKDAYPDVLAAVKTLGYDVERVKVIVHQFVTVLKDGEVVKMSTRKANYVTLDELIDDAGADAVRYFFSMRSVSSHMNFDVDLARKQNEENPVFYVQYAHARISSVLRALDDADLAPSAERLDLLVAPEERRLLVLLNRFPEAVRHCAEFFELHHMTGYLAELASAFHKFYTECRIIGSDKALAEARAALAAATRVTVANGLRLLGVSAPERM
ncbi:MAG: arginine--tRNA ligase [Ignavibacteriales bacterium]|nr:arginine--tRNA ligase [Ignavibacteriales bacterium]